MPEVWKPMDNSVYLEWIAMIKDELSDELNSWETNFIDSVEAWLTNGSNISRKQEEILEKIYARTP